jgi:hypothetical protein
MMANTLTPRESDLYVNVHGTFAKDIPANSTFRLSGVYENCHPWHAWTYNLSDTLSDIDQIGNTEYPPKGGWAFLRFNGIISRWLGYEPVCSHFPQQLFSAWMHLLLCLREMTFTNVLCYEQGNYVFRLEEFTLANETIFCVECQGCVDYEEGNPSRYDCYRPMCRSCVLILSLHRRGLIFNEFERKVVSRTEEPTTARVAGAIMINVAWIY